MWENNLVTMVLFSFVLSQASKSGPDGLKHLPLGKIKIIIIIKKKNSTSIACGTNYYPVSIIHTSVRSKWRLDW